MDMISLQGKTNFFERRVGDYQKAGVKMADDGEKANKAFCCDDEDFWKVFTLLELFLCFQIQKFNLDQFIK